MSSRKQRKDWAAKKLCPGCGKKPKAGRKRCEPCLARQRGYDKKFRMTQIEKGANMEPVCRPSTGPMHQDHDFDREIGVCRRCGARSDVAVAPSVTPRPMPRPIAIHAAPSFAELAAEQASTYPGAPQPKAKKAHPGHAHKPAEATKAAFMGRSLSVLPAAGKLEEPSGARLKAPEPWPDPPAEDVARVTDPLQAAIAALELEADELDIAIATLRRVQGRKVSA